MENCEAKKETEEENTEHEETSGNEEGTRESSRQKICVNIVLDDNVPEMKDLERCPSSVELRVPLYDDPTLPQGWSRKVMERNIFLSKVNNTHVSPWFPGVPKAGQGSVVHDHHEPARRQVQVET